MSRQSFWLLAALAGAALFAAFGLRPAGREAATPATVQVFAAELAARLDKIEQVRLIKAGNQTVVTLERTGQDWRVAERHGYPADVERLRTLLRGLAEARVLEAKTSSAEWYERLGVEDVAGNQAKGLLLEVSGGGEPWRVIIGQAGAQGGHYVRRPEDKQSWLIALDASPASELKSWLAPQILDIAAERVREVQVEGDDGFRLLRQADAGDATFKLEPMPEGRELAYPGAAAQPARTLTNLRLDDVLPAAEAGEPDAASLRRVRYLTRDGLVLQVEGWQKDGRHLARFQVSAEPADGQEGAAVKAEAEQLTQRLRDWVYVLPSYTQDNLLARLDSLLAPAKEAQTSSEPAPASAETPAAPADGGS
ncbi:MAG TPA: DUF4340 domain-containing protein [Candidatus Competibacteraceae bacterium]|nr:DUF4340 domain-containing protein [Candidatus Competibacteraceae bacterium]